jgi:hypothetical protein
VLLTYSFHRTGFFCNPASPLTSFAMEMAQMPAEASESSDAKPNEEQRGESQSLFSLSGFGSQSSSNAEPNESKGIFDNFGAGLKKIFRWDDLTFLRPFYVIFYPPSFHLFVFCLSVPRRSRKTSPKLIRTSRSRHSFYPIVTYSPRSNSNSIRRAAHNPICY